MTADQRPADVWAEAVDAASTLEELDSLTIEWLRSRWFGSAGSTSPYGAASGSCICRPPWWHVVVARIRLDIHGERPLTTPDGDLTYRGKAMLAFAGKPWRRAGVRDAAIRCLFDVSVTRYEQQIRALLDEPAALRFDPTLVNRLRRLQDARRAERDHPTRPAVLGRPISPVGTGT